MPVGCGAWPAWWTLGQSDPWPQGGEIGIAVILDSDDEADANGS